MVFEAVTRSDVRGPGFRRYTAFGRVIMSDLHLSALTGTATGEPCLTVRRLSRAPDPEGGQTVYEHLDRQGAIVYRLSCRDGVYLWSYPGVAAFTVGRDGRDVSWFADPARWADAAAVLAGPVLGFALQLQGQVGLHGSVVIIGESAVGLLAPSGYGKSTTAAALMGRGCALLTDDIAALDVRSDSIRVVPSYPKMKLWPEAIDSVAGHLKWRALPKHVSWLPKRVLPAEEIGAVCRMPRPLSALFALHPTSRDREVTVEPLRGHRALLELVAESYNAHLLVLEPDILAHQMEVLGRVAESVPAYRVSYPRRFDRLSHLTEAILATAGGGPCP